MQRVRCNFSNILSSKSHSNLPIPSCFSGFSILSFMFVELDLKHLFFTSKSDSIAEKVNQIDEHRVFFETQPNNPQETTLSLKNNQIKLPSLEILFPLFSQVKEFKFESFFPSPFSFFWSQRLILSSFSFISNHLGFEEAKLLSFGLKSNSNLKTLRFDLIPFPSLPIPFPFPLENNRFNLVFNLDWKTMEWIVKAFNYLLRSFSILSNSGLISFISFILFHQANFHNETPQIKVLRRMRLEMKEQKLLPKPWKNPKRSRK